MIKKVIRWITPPIILVIFNMVRSRTSNPNILFDGNDKLFKNILRKKVTKIYAEYGCGKSTNWVLKNTNTKVIAVDTSLEWVKEVKKRNSENLKIHYSDCGEVGAWGAPIDYSKCDNFSDYTDFIWKQADKPDVVLIDGRFRVCCFLTSLKHANEGTKILFDDYINRPHYHIVERYVPRMKVDGRQCLFVVPKKSEIDLEQLDKDIKAFRYVID
tara:strand:- start:1423 stop:2064 length:642 start_codon:yes stop_codon:yes gene_type:complete